MTRAVFLALVVLLVGCGRRAAPASPKMSYEAHMVEVERLEGEATRHEEAAEVARQRGTDYRCDTKPEQEQLTVGGERIVEGYRVCDDVALTDQRTHTAEAKRLRAQADQHRRQAHALLDGERGACAGFSFDRMRDTPLGRARARATVEPIDDGVRVTVPAERGVGVDEVRREMACHRARAALYDQTDYMGHDPSLVPASRLEVELSGTALVFTITGDDDVAVEQLRARANTLAAEPR